MTKIESRVSYIGITTKVLQFHLKWRCLLWYAKCKVKSFFIVVFLFFYFLNNEKSESKQFKVSFLATKQGIMPFFFFREWFWVFFCMLKVVTKLVDFSSCLLCLLTVHLKVYTFFF